MSNFPIFPTDFFPDDGASGSAASATTATSVTVSQLITAAFQRLNLVAAGEGLSPEDLAIGKARLNDLVDSWAIERLTMPAVSRTTWTISQTQDYTIGTSGTINVARPALSTAVIVKYQDTSQDPDLELDLGLLTEQAWQAIPQKAMTSVYPSCAYYNPTYSTGFGTISLWPIPTSTTLQGVLYAPLQISEFATTAETIVLPPGYRRALRDNLALEIAQDYQGAAQVTPQLEKSASDSKAAIKRANIRIVDTVNEAAALFSNGRPQYSIYTGP